MGITFDRQGLIPAVIVDDVTGTVLMVAFMNEEALQRTRESGQTHFFSRSRNTIWHKGEQSGNIQEVRDIFINCEENSLLIRVKQHGGAACHEGYGNCYYRRLLPDDSYETVAERVFDPSVVYHQPATAVVQPGSPVDSDGQGGSIMEPELAQQLENELRQLYGVYIYLRDHDLSEQSNTSRLLHDKSHTYLASRLADELQELAEVQTGEHVHSGRQPDTILEGSQVGYWLFLLASTNEIPYNTFAPHTSLLEGYTTSSSESSSIEMRQECVNLLAQQEREHTIRGLQLGFTLIGRACAEAEVSPLAPAEFDLEQMRRKGLVGK